jgi:hypothetical protein
VHKLPSEFNFTNYMCRSCIRYVLKLVEVAPVNWLFVMCFAALNVLRETVFDALFKTSDNDNECEEVEVQRRLAAGGDDAVGTKIVCFGYLVKMFFTVGCILMILNFTLLIISDKLFHRLMWRIYVHFDEMCRLVTGTSLRKHTEQTDMDDDTGAGASVGVCAGADVEAPDVPSFSKVPGKKEPGQGDSVEAGAGPSLDEEEEEEEKEFGDLNNDFFATGGAVSPQCSDSEAQQFLRMNSNSHMTDEEMESDFKLFKTRGFYESCLVLIAEENERAHAQAVEDHIKKMAQASSAAMGTPTAGVPGSARARPSMAASTSSRGKERRASFFAYSISSCVQEPEAGDRNFPLCPSHFKQQIVKQSPHARPSLAFGGGAKHRLLSQGSSGSSPCQHSEASMHSAPPSGGAKGVSAAFRRMSAAPTPLSTFDLSKSSRMPSFFVGRSPQQRLKDAYAKFGENVMRRRSSIDREDILEARPSLGTMTSLTEVWRSCKGFLMGHDETSDVTSPRSSGVEMRANTHWRDENTPANRASSAIERANGPVAHTAVPSNVSTSGSTSSRTAEGGFVRRSEHSYRTKHGYKQSALGLDTDEASDLIIDWNLRVIFPPGYSTIFYRAVSVMCLLNNVYVALWITDFTSLASEMDQYVLWQFAMAVPILVNFFVLHHTG